ncbi:hypothetical protein GO009_05090 [Muricauda sp. TY007]|uniref:bZIP transcription factor n=1 Tax=Allomuricauda sp. TY007 TaxID=2683200 RepID=UPI0013BF288A|nr:bZIP transcription factor [Muricauda sp. TY007]NDV15395.1 hypothetical protein [Muricauda sp. TY007]
MKTSIVYLIMGLLVINSLSAQVKIGDNPQNLDPSSILELQSTSRVLVITRVTDAQMNNISPLQGAVVYNTDQECLHYYNGTEWINICEALDNSFTTSTRADSLRQIDPNARDNTIIITETTNPDESINYNFEVNRITGANIETGAVNGDKIQGSVVDTRHIVNQAVTFGKLQSGTNEGDLFMWNGSSWNFVNRSDLLNTQLDSIVGNEVFDATPNGSLERFGLGTQDDPYTLDVTDGGIDTSELADDAVTTEKILDGNVTNEKLEKGNIPLSGFGAAEDNVDLDGNRLINLADPTAPLDAVNLQYLEGAIASSDAADLDTNPENELQSLSLTSDQLSISNDPTVSPVNLSGYLDNTDEQDLELNGDNLTLTGDPTATPIDLSGYTNNDTNELQSLSLASDQLSISNDPTASPVNLSGYLDNTDEQDLELNGDNLTLTGDPTATPVDLSGYTNNDTNELQSLSLASDQLSISNDPTASPVNLAGYLDNTDEQDLELTSNILTLSGDPTPTPIDLSGYINTDEQNLSIGGNGIPNESVEILISGGTGALVDVRDQDFDPTNEIQNITTTGLGLSVSQIGQDFLITNDAPDQTVTLIDGGNGNVTIGGAYPDFTIDVPDIVTYTAGLGINISGTNEISTTNLAGDVTGPIDATVIEPGAVNSSKIADGTIVNADIAAGAAIDGSKINPVFTNDVSTTGDFISNGTILDVPDFVFQKYFNGYSSLNNEYRFRNLDEIEAFIRQNNHLPGIKSANEIKAAGKYYLTESSMAQLEKIEELFLHTIEQEKKIENLQSDNENLSKELDSLKAEMKEIKTMLLEKSQN